MNELQRISAARQALEKATTVEEVKDIRDKAEALRYVVKQAGMGLEAQNECAEIKIRAEIKGWELLKEIGFGEHGGNRKSSCTMQLDDFGVTKYESHRWHLEADVPQDKREEYIKTSIEKPTELTSAGLIRIARQLQRQDDIEALKAKIRDGIDLPEGVFEIIVIDPPWPYGTLYNPDTRRAANPYPEMSIEQIRDEPYPFADDCICWLWTTHKFMHDAFHLIEAWGFRDVAIVTWVKNSIGLGAWLRSQSEFCIMAVKGKPVVDLSNQSTVINAPVTIHSEKPEAFYKMVDTLCIGRKLDYYCRTPREGWEGHGTRELE